MGGRSSDGLREASARLRIRLLGEFDVEVGGRSVEVGGPQQRAVLAILALDPGRTVSTDRIAARLWGESAPASALNTLQSYVSRLRSVLDPDRPAGTPSVLIVGSIAGYLLAVDRAQVDAYDFQRLAADGREALRRGDHRAAETLLADALSLWRGPALSGLNGDGMASLAVRWEQERLNAIADLADAQLAIGHHDAAITGLREAVSHDPLHERLWTRLALALYRSGHQVDALRALTDARDALADASGLIASPELHRLEAQILAHDPALSPSGAAPLIPTLPLVPAAPLVPADQPVGLVGRADEWTRLLARLDEPIGVVMIEGEAGIGKTTLLDAFADEAVARSCVVVRGRCHQDGLTPALWPWIEIVRQRGGSFDEVGAGASMVEMSQIVAERLQPFGDERVTVIIDDLHWADAATIEMLILVAQSLAGVPVVFALGFRPVDIGSDSPLALGLGSLSRIAGGRRMTLTGLDRADVATLIGGIAGRVPTAAETDSVHRRTGGNPLFVSELTRLSGCRESNGSAPTLDAADVPDLIRDVVRDRIAGLPERSRDMLAVAAVVGDRADIRVLAHAAHVDVLTCAEALEPALAARIVILLDDGDVRFAHAILRDALLVDTSALRRSRSHLAVADAIAHVFGDDPDHAEPMAVHRWNARPLDDPALTSRSLIVAARTARRNGALSRANEFVEMALAAAEQCPRGEVRSSLEIDAMETFLAIETSRSFMTDNLDDIAERMEALAQRRRSDAVAQLARYTRWSNLNSAPVHLVEDIAAAGLHAASRSDDPYVQIFGFYMWAVQRWLTGDIEQACAHFELGLTARDALGAAATTRAGLSLGGLAAVAFAQAGNVERAMAGLDDEATRAASLPVRPAIDGEGAFMASLVGVALGDPALVLRSSEPLAAARRSEFPLYTPACIVMHGWASALANGTDESESMLKALADLEANGVRVVLSMLQTLYGETLLRFGDVAAATGELRDARAEALDRGEHFWLARTEALLADAEQRA